MSARGRWIVAVAVAAALAVGGAIAYREWGRGPTTAAELVSYLPDKNGTVLYVGVAAMRRSGVLRLIAGSKAVQDSDYQAFVRQTGFDYSRDLDALAGTFRSNQLFLVARGRFDWAKLRSYAESEHGSCRNGYCTVPGSQPQKRISFYKLRSNLLALASSNDDMAAYQIERNASRPNPMTPAEPVWVLVPAAALREAQNLPSGLRAFALLLQDAERIVFTVGAEGDHLQVAADVTCRTPENASSLMIQFENTTNLLRRLLERQHEKPNDKDLSGVLVAGTFRREGNQVHAQWPIPRAFINGLGEGEQ